MDETKTAVKMLLFWALSPVAMTCSVFGGGAFAS